MQGAVSVVLECTTAALAGDSTIKSVTAASNPVDPYESRPITRRDPFPVRTMLNGSPFPRVRRPPDPKWQSLSTRLGI